MSWEHRGKLENLGLHLAIALCDSNNLPRASITRRTHTDYQPIIIIITTA